MKILLAIDGSACSNAAVDEVCRRPWPAGAELRVITVLPPLEPGLGGAASSSSGLFGRVLKRQNDTAAGLLRAAAADIERCAPELRVAPLLLEGRPKDVILDEAERWGADLIIVGSHGYGTVKRLFLGSVSLAVALNAPCSVEIVRCRDSGGIKPRMS